MNNNNRNSREPVPVIPKESLREKLHGWRLAFSPDGESIVKGIVCAFLLVIFALTQTTLFTRFRPFGAVPDLILPLTAAVAMAFREKWGAVFGLIAAFVIESLGGSSVTILPILYMLTGYIVGLLSVYYFRDSIAVRALYTVSLSAARAVFTMITLSAAVDDIDFLYALTNVIFPEFLANITFAALPHITAKLVLMPFTHDRKEE